MTPKQKKYDRLQRKLLKDVTYEQWPTSIGGSWSIWLAGTLTTRHLVHFFFTTYEEKHKHVHVMTVHRFSPYRVTEEKYAYDCVGKYFAYGKNQTLQNQRKQYYKTWKMWNTDFLKDLDEGSNALSEYAKERDSNIYSYLIITMDEWIEVVSHPDEPQWKIFKNKTIKDVMYKYVNIYGCQFKRK